MPHDLGRNGEEMRAVAPSGIYTREKPEKRLLDQGGRLHGMFLRSWARWRRASRCNSVRINGKTRSIVAGSPSCQPASSLVISPACCIPFLYRVSRLLGTHLIKKVF